MTRPVPERLRHEPLLEALWEIRFSSDKEPVVELLPGLIFSTFAKEYPKLMRLPASNLPPVLLQSDQNLRYVPLVRLEGHPYAVQVGEHVVSLNCSRPYTGWEAFRPKIGELARVLRETGLISHPERFSLKYINLISLTEPPSLSVLNVHLSLGDHQVQDTPVQIRTEIREDGLVHIVQVASPTEIALPDGSRSRGVLVDVDTICYASEEDFWAGLDVRLDRVHTLSKRLFFTLLTDEAIQQLGPEYGGQHHVSDG